MFGEEIAPMLRIYCDWNNGIDEKRFDLGCPGSMAEINRYTGELRDGLRVMLYQTDELEAEGILEFDPRTKRWIGIPDWSTKRFIGRSASHEKKA